jgi:hypothetical protein
LAFQASDGREENMGLPLALNLIGQAPAIVGLVGDFVHLVEGFFRHLPGQQGAAKKEVVKAAASDALNIYAKVAGALAGKPAVDTSELQSKIDQVIELEVWFQKTFGSWGHLTTPASS